MKNKSSWNQISYLSAFIIGAILFWSIGRNWLNLKSTPIFLAGVTGVATVVLSFAAWNIYYNSHHKEN